MGMLNSKKSGLFAMIQPSVAPNGSTVITTAIAPQQTIMANASATLEPPLKRPTHQGLPFHNRAIQG